MAGPCRQRIRNQQSGATRRDRTDDLLIVRNSRSDGMWVILGSAGSLRSRGIRPHWPVLNPGSGRLLPKNFYTEKMERSEYIGQRNGGFYVVGTRVSLDSIVYSFKAGDSPRTIRQNFSSLILEQVYGAIAFYLAHEQEVDSNIREGDEEIQRSVPPLSESRPELYARLERARHEIASHS